VIEIEGAKAKVELSCPYFANEIFIGSAFSSQEVQVFQKPVLLFQPFHEKV
jgi:hypothetical protein